MGSGQTLDILEVKSKVAEIKRMVAKLCIRMVISEPKVTNIVPEVHINNIRPILDLVKETQVVEKT